MDSQDKHWYSRVSAPLNVAEDTQWDQEVDVIVVGFGGAGACAALQAIEEGATVMVIDRFEGGGATAISGGIYYAGGGTEYQKQAGFEDSPENMFRYLQMETEGVVSDSTLKKFCDDSLDNMDWLQKQGVRFNSTLSPVKTSYPSNRYFLYYSGNEPVAEYRDQADPAPRGHRTYGKGLSGAEFFEPLRRSLVSQQCRLSLHTEVLTLMTSEEGEVLGVQTREYDYNDDNRNKHHSLYSWYQRLRMIPPLGNKLAKKIEELEVQKSATRNIRARRGVILSTGGFVFNSAMLKHYAPSYSEAMPLGTPGCHGDGLRLGQSVGGKASLLERISAWRFINPPFSWAKGVVVNGEGKRYVNEQVYGAKLGYHMVEENQGKAILIVNWALLKESLKDIFSGKAWFFQAMPALLNILFNCKRGKTLQALAEKCQLDSSNLLETVQEYNAACTNKTEDAFRKGEEFMAAMEEGPYFAMDVSIDSKIFPCPIITLGGLTVNEESGQVLDAEDQPVPGLYAAGRTAVGIPSRFYVSGLSLADCVFSGRRAGKHAAST